VTIRSRAWCGALALALLAPAVASAQPPRNPFAELFGRVPERSGREFTAVQFRSTAGAQVGQTLQENFQVPDAVIPEGLSGGADAALSAEYMRDRVQLAAQGRYSYQEYRKAPAFGAAAADVSIRAAVKPTTKLMFDGGGSFARSPYFQFMWLSAAQAGSMAPIDRGAILLMRNDTVEGNAGITSFYTRRSSINVTATVRETNFELQPQHSFTSVGGRAQWRRQMSRDLAVHAGYGREELRQRRPGVDTVFTNELLDIGVDYGRSLSLARRTFFSFGTETSMLRDQDGTRHFRLNGNIVLEHRFQRTWVAQLSARRGTDLMPGFVEPVFSDHAHVALAGFLAKRLILNLDADGGQGAAGFSDPRKFVSYAGNARLTFAITRHLGVFTQYVYYHYQMPPDPQTLFLVPTGARQAVSFGVQTWVSIFDKEKVIRDPR
jgi:hypothetical protein